MRSRRAIKMSTASASIKRAAATTSRRVQSCKNATAIVSDAGAPLLQRSDYYMPPLNLYRR